MIASVQQRQIQAPTRTSRNSAIELLRTVGAVGIVWFHMHGPYSWVGYAALPMFIQMTVFYGVGGASPLPPMTIVRRRIARLLPIWLFWSAAFAAMRILDALLAGAPPIGWVHGWMIATGASLHLWFLPFALVGTCVIGAWLAFAKHNHPVLEATVLAVLSLAALQANAMVGHGPPLPQWLFGLPSVFVAISLVRWQQDPRAYAIGIPWLLVFTVASFIDGSDHYREFILATAAFALALAAGPKINIPLISTLSGLTLGIYLVHPAVVSIFVRLHAIEKLNGNHAILVVLLCSALLTWVLTKLPLVNRYV